MKLKTCALVAALALLLATALAGVASATQSAPKPGFLPGTWIGKGQIRGHVTDGPMDTFFEGAISFTVKVNDELGVTGAGKWQMTMLGTQDAVSDDAIDSTMRGSASIRLMGTGSSVSYAGTQHVVGELRAYGVIRSLKPFDQPLKGRLVIRRAGKCKVSGTSQVQPGVTLTWSAQLKGSGKCNA